MSKRKTVITLCVCASMLLTGCFGGEEANGRAFAELMSIEHENGEYSVSLQLYSSGSSDGRPDISKANSSVVSGSGAALHSALADAEAKAGKKLFLGQVKLIVLREGAALPAEELYELSKDGALSLSCPAVCSRDPESVISLELEDGLYSAYRIMQLTEANVKNGRCVYTPAAEAIGNALCGGAAVPLPVIKAEKDGVSFDGAVCADTNGSEKLISAEEMTGLILLNGGLRRGVKITVPAEADGRSAAAVIESAKTRRSADVKDGRLRVKAEIKLRISVKNEPQGLSKEEISEAVCENVRDSCISAFSSAVWYGGADIFGLYKLIARDCPELLGADRETLLKESLLNINVEVRM